MWRSVVELTWISGPLTEDVVMETIKFQCRFLEDENFRMKNLVTARAI